MSAFAATSLTGKRRLTRMLALGLAALLALAPGTALFAQIDDLSEPADFLGDWQSRPEYSLSLDECLRLAMDHNLDIIVQGYERGISDTGVGTAKSAFDSVIRSNFTESESNNQNANPFFGLPQFTFKTRAFDTNWNDPTMWGGNFNIFFQAFKQRSTEGASTLIPSYQAVLNLTYRQSLLRNFGRAVNEAPIVIARNNTRISDSQFRNTVMVTLEAAEAAYWELAFARRDLEVKRQSHGLAQKLLKINKAKVEVGTLAPIDVTQAEAGVASRLEDLIVAVGSLLNAEDSLRQLLNPGSDHPIWSSTLVLSNQPEYVPVEVNEQEAIDVAKANRPELKQQQITIESNALQEKIDRKAKRWDLFVEGFYGQEGVEGRLATTVCDDPDFPSPDTCRKVNLLDTDLGDALNELNDTTFRDWRLQAGVTIPIHNRQAKSRYGSSRLRHEQSRMQMQNLMLAAEIDVRQKVRDVKVNTQRVRAAQKNRELQEKNVDAEEKKYQNGMSTSFQVLEIQEDLATAESRESRAKVDFQKSLAALERAKGTLLQARNIEISSLHDLGGQEFAGGGHGLSGSGR